MKVPVTTGPTEATQELPHKPRSQAEDPRNCNAETLNPNAVLKCSAAAMSPALSRVAAVCVPLLDCVPRWVLSCSAGVSRCARSAGFSGRLHTLFQEPTQEVHTGSQCSLEKKTDFIGISLPRWGRRHPHLVQHGELSGGVVDGGLHVEIRHTHGAPQRRQLMEVRREKRRRSNLLRHSEKSYTGMNTGDRQRGGPAGEPSTLKDNLFELVSYSRRRRKLQVESGQKRV